MLLIIILLLFPGSGLQYSGREGQHVWTNGDLCQDHFPWRGGSCWWKAAGGWGTTYCTWSTYTHFRISVGVILISDSNCCAVFNTLRLCVSVVSKSKEMSVYLSALKVVEPSFKKHKIKAAELLKRWNQLKCHLTCNQVTAMKAVRI